uniref:Uncharacterized protein n=1 Tax=Rhizophora mucronata TaxID=61149 RepID=A0A2P2IX72_RHIMU
MIEKKGCSSNAKEVNLTSWPLSSSFPFCCYQAYRFECMKVAHQHISPRGEYDMSLLRILAPWC